MPNPSFDLVHWSHACQDQAADINWFIPAPISSPVDVVKREIWVLSHPTAFDGYERRPVCYHVHGFGEPPLPFQSKMGGIPYRPRLAPWPTNADGVPMQFFGQINVSDSRDLVPEARGDVLVIFHSGESSCSTEEFHFEWYDEGLNDLPSETELPFFDDLHIDFPIHFESHRSDEWIVPSDASDDLREYDSLVATKIGGVPAYFGDSIPELPGRYFMTIDSLQIGIQRPFPALNRYENLTMEEAGGYYAITFIRLGDLGSLFFHIDAHGTVYCTGQCH